jgi:delta 1-pyrroline-5-carboxylate dehydrogenase
MTPKSDKIKTVDAGKAERQGRLVKAQQFLQSADDLRGLYEDDSVVADTAATL